MVAQDEKVIKEEEASDSDDFDDEPVLSVLERKKKAQDKDPSIVSLRMAKAEAFESKDKHSKEDGEVKFSNKKAPKMEESFDIIEEEKSAARGRGDKESMSNHCYEKKVAAKIKRLERDDDEDGGYDEDDEEFQTRKISQRSVKVKKILKEEKRESDEEKNSSKRKASARSGKENKKLRNAVRKQREAKGKKEKHSDEKHIKKVYPLPGQKTEPPEARDPLRIFYESLYKQLPRSDMAAFRMMEWGLLPEDEAKKIYERKLKNAQKLQHQKVVTVSLTANRAQSQQSRTAVVTEVTSGSSKKRGRLGNDSDEDEFMVSAKKIRKLIT